MSIPAMVILVGIVIVLVLIVPSVYSMLIGGKEGAQRMADRAKDAVERVDLKDSKVSDDFEDPDDFEKPLPSTVVLVPPAWLRVCIACLVVIASGVVVWMFDRVGMDDFSKRTDDISAIAILWVLKQLNVYLGTFGGEMRGVAFVLLCIVFVPFIYSALNTKQTFSDTGVTVNTKLYLLFFVIYRKNLLIPWHDFISVAYDGTQSSFLINATPFKLHHTQSRFYVFIDVQNHNHRDALRFAVKYIDKGKFELGAKHKLRKMGLYRF